MIAERTRGNAANGRSENSTPSPDPSWTGYPPPQALSRPIVDAFFSWCDAESPSVLDDTPISDGIRYARNQRVGLSRFLDDGRLPIHNNLSELALRPEAVGPKNWLFVGSDDAPRGLGGTGTEATMAAIVRRLCQPGVTQLPSKHCCPGPQGGQGAAQLSPLLHVPPSMSVQLLHVSPPVPQAVSTTPM